MSQAFYERPILNSPYEYPGRHWQLDDRGLPTDEVVETRRKAEFISPVPPRRRRPASRSSLYCRSGRRSCPRPSSNTTLIRSSTGSVGKWTAGAACPKRSGA